MTNEKAFNRLPKYMQCEVEDIYSQRNSCDNTVVYTINLKNHDRSICGSFDEVKWELGQMIKRNDFTLQW